MPLPCDSPRYRYRKGTNIRLAFCGNKVVEAKKMGKAKKKPKK